MAVHDAYASAVESMAAFGAGQTADAPPHALDEYLSI